MATIIDKTACEAAGQGQENGLLPVNPFTALQFHFGMVLTTHPEDDCGKHWHEEAVRVFRIAGPALGHGRKRRRIAPEQHEREDD